MGGRESAKSRSGADRGSTKPGSASHLTLVRRRDGHLSEAEVAHARKVSLILLFVPTAVLTVLGLAMILSAGSISAVEGYGTSFWYFNRQVIYAVAGIAAMLIAWRLPHTVWQKLCLPMLVAILPLMLIALHPSHGTALYGASRWIDLGPVTLQPAEFLKLAVVVFAATVLANKWHKLDDPVHLLIPLAPVMGAISLLVILQRDLGTTVILCGTVFMILFVAGVRMRYLSITGAVGLIGVAYLIFGETYRRTRFVDSFLNPWADPEGSGFQLIQGLIALGSGGWTGVGLGASRQKWDYLPNAHSDFIFAIIGEELGLLGALFVLVMFGLLLFAGVRIAMRAPDTFGRLLAAGVTAWIGLQAIVNLGAVTGVLPITGVPLPLVSFGGTALVVTLAGVGVLASVARAPRRTGARAIQARPMKRSTASTRAAAKPRSRAGRPMRVPARGSGR
jgi:cell division protein FtsW